MTKANFKPHDIEAMIRGLYVLPIHLFERADRRRRMAVKVRSLGPSAIQQTFDMNDEGTQVNITVADYFAKHHERQLAQPDLPVLVCTLGSEAKGNKMTVFFPMELCMVLDNQRITTSQQNNDVVSRLIKVRRMPFFHCLYVNTCFR